MQDNIIDRLPYKTVMNLAEKREEYDEEKHYIDFELCSRLQLMQYCSKHKRNVLIPQGPPYVQCYVCFVKAGVLKKYYDGYCIIFIKATV